VRIASPLAEEVDVETEYRDWLRDVLEPARTLASAGSRGKTERFAGCSWGLAHRLAALFALVSLGLAVWVVQLHREVVRLTAPVFDVPSEEILLGGESRGSTRLKIPRASHVLIDLVLHPAFARGEGRFEITDAAGTLVWRGLASTSNRPANSSSSSRASCFMTASTACGSSAPRGVS